MLPKQSSRNVVETPLGTRLLEILRESGEWMTRKQIAAVLGRPDTLTPYDWQVLRELATDGHIEMDTRKIGAVKREYIYKVK